MFSLSPDQTGYLRGLEQELEEETNSIRIELNRLQATGLIHSHSEGNKKVYKANRNYPWFAELRSIALKHFGIDTLLDMLRSHLGTIDAVYLAGDLARGLDSHVIDIVVVAERPNRVASYTLVEKVEHHLKRSIRALFLQPNQLDRLPEPNLLVYGNQPSKDLFTTSVIPTPNAS